MSKLAPAVMTIDQVAAYMQQHRRTVLRHLRAGRIRGTKTGEAAGAPWRILKSEVDKFLKGAR